MRLLDPDREFPMERDEWGYFSVAINNVDGGARYYYQTDDSTERPDPASRYQPDGVHGPSQIIDSAFEWTDSGWRGLPIQSYVIYELHVGTFTREGTFDAILPHLDNLKALGITAIELMPVAQCPGSRNWGYDGVYPYAVQNSFGEPDALRRLVNECHNRGIAVVLDVVYNHLGPEGNYLRDFAPYFTDHYRTPWGEAVNFDQRDSDHVRHFFTENARYWIREFHIDALRLDAVHAIYDFSARPFLLELKEIIEQDESQLGRRIAVISESDLNDRRIIGPRIEGGFQHDAQWSDDFHHCVHTLLTGENRGYYRDFGSVEQLAKAHTHGFVYEGEYAPARGRRHGNSSLDRPAEQFVVCSQNHDQVGNRMNGERLVHLAGLAAARLAAFTVILSPFIPLIFMGEEYGETAPFQYFVSHGDAALVDAVRKGRADEFKAFNWNAEPPDPQSEETFRRSTLDHDLKNCSPHQQLYSLYKTLLTLRREHPVLCHLGKTSLSAQALEKQKVLLLRRWFKERQVLLLMNFSRDAQHIDFIIKGNWRKLLDTEDNLFGGADGNSAPGYFEEGIRMSLHKYSAVLYEHKGT